MAADAGELKARATLDNTEFLSSLKDLVSQIKSNSDAAVQQVDGISGSFEAMAKAVGALKVAKFIEDFAGDCMDASVAASKLQNSMELLAGSAEAGDAVFESMKDLGLHSMFDFADVLGPAAQQMLLLSGNAEQTTETMTALVDAAAAMKQGPAWINEVAGAIDAMQSHLVATQRDMKALEKAGVDAWGALAESIGVSIAQAQDMVKKGEIEASTVTKAVTDELGAQFEGAAALAGNTWRGAMHTLSESGEEAKAAIGDSIYKLLNDFAPVLNTLAEAVQNVTTWWKGLPGPVQDVVLAVGAALPIIVALSAALPVLEAAIGAVAVAFTGPVAPIVALVAALALIGKWVYDEWPAIQAVFLALWDDIVAGWQSLWGGVGDWFNSTFGGIAQGVASIWNGLKTAVGGVIDFFVGAFNDFMTGLGRLVGGLGTLVGSIPGVSKVLGDVTAAWNSGQAAIKANTDELAKQKAQLKENQIQTQATLNARKQQESADLAAANRAKEAASAQKAAAAEAKKQAEEEKAWNEALKKTYDDLYAVAPDVAKQFNEMYGGMNDDAAAAQKLMGKFWGDIDAAEQQVIISTVALGNAYKALSLTGEAGLEGQAQKVSAAFDTLAASGTASSGTLEAGWNKVVASQQKIVDQMNTDVKDAYSKGTIDADTYYSDVIARAEQHYNDVAALVAQDKATQSDAAAAYQTLENAKQAAIQHTTDVYTAGMNAVGQQTQEQLSKSTALWSDYSDLITEKLGSEAPAAIQAMIKYVQSLIAEQTALGKAPPDDLTKWLKNLQNQLEATKTPTDQLNDAMKALGLTSTASLTEQINKAADALVKVQELQRAGVATAGDVASAQKALFDLVGKQITQYNEQYTPAIQKNDQTAQQAAQNNLTSATQVQQALTQTGNSAEASAAIQVAAAQQTAKAYTENMVAAQKTISDAYKTLGVETTLQLTQSAEKAQAAYDALAASGSASAVQLKEAWVRNTQIQMDTTIQMGGQVTEAEKNELARQQQDLQNHLDITTSTWKTAYDGIHSAVSNMFDDLTKKIVTGQGSFKDIMTNMWQSVAESALKAFLEPVTKAIENFIATTIADLLSGKGLGGVIDSIKGIGSAMGGIFGGASSAAGGAINSVELPGSIFGMGGGAGSAAGGASGAAGAVSGALGGVTGIFGAVGSIGSMISGIIGNFQSARQETTLNAIESNTRYAELYLGGRADQGILGVLFHINESLQEGSIVQVLANFRDLFEGWKNDLLLATLEIRNTLWGWEPYVTTGTPAVLQVRDILLGWGPYIADSKDALFAIRDICNTFPGLISTGFQQMTVTINAGNLTTAEAARALGNQIAANLTTQLVAVK